MAFFAATSFIRQLARLTEKSKLGYSSCPQDICKFFNKYSSFDVLWAMPIRLNEVDNLQTKKHDIANSQDNLGANNGFRIIYLLNKATKDIVLLYVYPKRGKYQEIDITDKYLQVLIESYISDSTNAKLIEVDIKNSLVPIEKETAKPSETTIKT